MAKKPPPLPPFAEKFLATDAARGARVITIELHRWMRQHDVGVRQLTAIEAKRFLDQGIGGVPRMRTRQSALLRYLEWLRNEELLLWDPDELRQHPKRLSARALQFIAGLEVTLKPGTCNAHRTALRKFEGWLNRSRVTLNNLDRRHTEQWLASLHREGLHASTRRHVIIDVRAYLRWLFDRQYIVSNPEDLIRRTDLPKLPHYLPRPLSPTVDAELQKRLKRSSLRVHQALLLMRQTGLRCGELRRLPYDCIRVDPAGRRMLKVPLGKMYNERLVPLSDESHALIEHLQKSGNPRRAWLIQTRRGRPLNYQDYRRALHDVSRALPQTDGKIVTHRLRHTFATSLLAGGMNLINLMTVLGHRDHRMTLRYAAVTPETIHEEYTEALSKLTTRYGIKPPVGAPMPADPAKLITDLIRWLQSHSGGDRETAAIIKRLSRINRWLTRTKK